MSHRREIENLKARVEQVYVGMENMKMNVKRTENLLALKLKEDCERSGVPTPVIVDYFNGVKHLIQERLFNHLEVKFPEGDYLPPATKIKILQWCEKKEMFIVDESPAYAFAVYMSILVRFFIEEKGKWSTEFVKGRPLLICDKEELPVKEKLDVIKTIHNLYREANDKTFGMVFSDLVEELSKFDRLNEKEQMAFVESRSLASLIRWKTPFASNAFDFMADSGYYDIPDKARFEHTHIIARSGHGKTQLLENFIFNDIMRAHDETIGLCVIDGQGDLIKDIKNLKALSPIQDRVILIDPSDIENPFCLNPFDIGNVLKGHLSPLKKQELYTNAVSLLEFVFSSLGASMTAKQTVLFRNVVELLISMEGSTLMSMKELLEDSSPFVPYYENLDPITKDFFLNQFDKSAYSDTKYQVLTRLFSILKTPALAGMFTAKSNQLDLYEEMNRGAIILVDTDKHLLKQDGHSLLGRYFLALIVQSAYKRKFIEEDERTPFFVYVDECHDYIDENVGMLLDQARKYKVGMVLSHQLYDQMDTRLKSTVKTNTNVKLYGALSAKDRKASAREIDVDEEYLRGLKSVDREGAEYVVKIGNEKPAKVFAPFGIMSNAGKIEQKVLNHILRKNRERYCSGTVKFGADRAYGRGVHEAKYESGKGDNANEASRSDKTNFDPEEFEEL